MKTSKNLTGQLTLDELILSAEASHANHLAQQESGEGHPTIDTYGRKCSELFDKLAPRMSWRRTFVASLVGIKGWYSTRCVLTWKVKASKSFRSYFLLQASTRRTAGTESGLLPTVTTDSVSNRTKKYSQGGTPLTMAAQGLLLTPTTREEPVDLDKFKARMEKYPNGTTMPNLATQVQQMLPTPRAVEFVETPENFAKRTGDRTTNAMPNLSSMAQHVPQMLPMPMSRDYKGARSLEARQAMEQNSKRGLSLSDAYAKPGKTSHLSPLFVEEMMGFPQGWTASPFQSGGESP